MSSKILSFASYAVSFLQILTLAGAFALNHFFQKRMGVARHIVSEALKWESKGDIEIYLFISTAIICVFCGLATMRLRRSLKMRNMKNVVHAKIEYALLILISLAVCLFVIFASFESLKLYYHFILIFYIVWVLQYLKTLLIQ